MIMCGTRDNLTNNQQQKHVLSSSAFLAKSNYYQRYIATDLLWGKKHIISLVFYLSQECTSKQQASITSKILAMSVSCYSPRPVLLFNINPNIKIFKICFS